MEIHYADKAYRNRTLLLLALTTLLCAVALLVLDGWLGRIDAHLATADLATVRRWLRGLFTGLGVGLAVPAALLGLGLRRLGFTARLEGRFPPRHWKTLRDVRVLRDAAALQWARRTEALGTFALLLSAGLLGWAAWAWWRFA